MSTQDFHLLAEHFITIKYEEASMGGYGMFPFCMLLPQNLKASYEVCIQPFPNFMLCRRSKLQVTSSPYNIIPYAD